MLFRFHFYSDYGESGKEDGIFNAVIETTYRVINERGAISLQALGDAINSVSNPEDVYQKTSYRYS